MNSLLLLVPLSLVLVVVAGWAFAWAVKRGQFDDLDTPSLDILVDDIPVDNIPVDGTPVDGTLVDGTRVDDTPVDGAARARPAPAGQDEPDAIASATGTAAERGDA